MEKADIIIIIIVIIIVLGGEAMDWYDERKNK